MIRCRCISFNVIIICYCFVLLVFAYFCLLFNFLTRVYPGQYKQHRSSVLQKKNLNFRFFLLTARCWKWPVLPHARIPWVYKYSLRILPRLDRLHCLSNRALDEEALGRGAIYIRRSRDFVGSGRSQSHFVRFRNCRVGHFSERNRSSKPVNASEDQQWVNHECEQV